MRPNILVPMAGLGSRFVKEGFTVPKQLINIKDRQLIDISISCIDTANSNLIFVIRDDQVYNFRMDDILKKKFGEDIKIVVLDKLTDGSVSSCLFAKEYIDNDEPLVIHTLDIEFAPIFNPHDLYNINSDGIILTFKSNSSNYSYAKVDNGYVSQTAEKKAISQNACVGIYGFRKGSDFCKCAEKMISLNIRTNNEFYIAPLYNLLIQDGLHITTQEVEKMHVFGTPEEFNFYKNNVIKKFGEKPIALCSDHSGYHSKELLKNILNQNGLKYIDYGTMVEKDCNYTDYINQTAKAIRDGDCDYAFGFCRTGQGVNMCANKNKGIRCALVYDDNSMEMAIRHNCSNFFAIPSISCNEERLNKYLKIASNNSFDGGRHQIRVQELS
jgi:RpiB/LacA/LacB family sugar-phosphate isomerase